MLNTEESCIRYLMRELDPAEEIEFEREMLKDENLLIEVESLRKIYHKLGSLPLMQPPQEITNKINNMAAEISISNSRPRVLLLYFSKAVASVAAALLLILAGIYFYGQPLNIEQYQPVVADAVEIMDEVHPWVDRDDVIQFAGTARQPNMTESLQSDVNQSYSRLKLVSSETGLTTPNRKIVLTRVTR
jgi:hypothetical protein